MINVDWEQGRKKKEKGKGERESQKEEMTDQKLKVRGF